jgi:hypothetical protein
MKTSDPYSLYLAGPTNDPKAPKYGKAEQRFKDTSAPLELACGVHFKWQKRAFDYLKNAMYSLLVACCGSGKTTVQVFLSVFDIKNQLFRKQLIVVPQNHIHKGFCSFSKNGKSTDYLTLLYQKKPIQWKIPSRHNFCSRKNETVLGLMNFLKADCQKNDCEFQISENTALATHKAIAMAWDRLSHPERIKAIQNLTLRIDESHHIRGVVHPEDREGHCEQDFWGNKKTGIGRVCEFILKHNDGTTKICLTTATHFRGDKDDIISPKYMDKFKTFKYEWLEHWKTLGLKGLDFGYQVYQKNPILNVAKNIKKEPNQKHIIYIPPRKQKYRKEATVKQYVEALMAEGVQKEKILDLVTETTKLRNKRRLINDPLSIDVIIAVNLMNEGSDWVPADRIHNTHNERSLTLSLQRLGRLFRFYKKKKDIKVINYIPKFKKVEGDEAREALSDRFNCILLVLQMEEFLQPVDFPCTPTPENPTGIKRVNLIERLGQEVFDNLWNYTYNTYENLKVKDSKHVEALLNRAVQKHVPKKLRENNADIVKILGLKLRRKISPEISKNLLDPSFLREHYSFDKIWPEKGPDSLYIGLLDPLTEREFLTIKKLARTWRETRKIEAMVQDKEKAFIDSSINNTQESCLPSYSGDTLTVKTLIQEYEKEKGGHSKLLSGLVVKYGDLIIRRNGIASCTIPWLKEIKNSKGPIEVLKALTLMEKVRDLAEKRNFLFSIHNEENDHLIEKLVERTAFKIRGSRYFVYGCPRWNRGALELKLENQNGKKITCSLDNLYVWSLYKNRSWTDLKIVERG